MKSEKFCKWLEKEKLPKLESPNIIVMDKKMDHKLEINKKTSNYILWNGCHGIEWISVTQTPGINYPSWGKGRKNGDKKKNVANEITMKNGHLPLYHPDLNSIEPV